MPGEAVTLQLGHYAGCVGAHWWGLQAAALRSPGEHNELRAAALLRSARGPGGTESPEPRLVALELKGGVGALRADGADTEPPVSWDGAVADCRERGRAPRDTGSRRGDAAGDAKGNAGAAGPGSSPAGSQDAPSPRLWSDYLSVNLHPQSLYVIRQYLHDGDCGCLEGFGQGESLLQDPACVEELEDRLHFFVEECDYLQGFQVLCDLHNGFSGVGARVTELLHDEYARKGILTWGLTPVLAAVGDPQKSFCRLMNTALGIAHLSRHSSLFCPLSLNGSLGLRPEPPVTFPYIKYNASLSYHSSAVLAAALDTLTAPYRLCSSQASMLHLADSLTFSGRKPVLSPKSRLWLPGQLCPCPPWPAPRCPTCWVPTGTCPGSSCPPARSGNSAPALPSRLCCEGCARSKAAAGRERAPSRCCSSTCTRSSREPSAPPTCSGSPAPPAPPSRSSSLLC
ncbi:protein misato homolog 1 isoform X3 [Zonotrichia albicollis]|uniref:protein misato homolog 1 isoform X3 n=1 Tax=Zonotrichia albicollis TaxID=44394 RepID=UPI003D8112A3